MSTVRYGVLADDLTGALGSAARLREAGLRTVVRWTPAALPGDAEAVVVDMRTRDDPDPEVGVVEWATRLAAEGCEWVELRVDSTLRGEPARELGDVLAGLRRPGALAFAVPAFPDAGRRVIGGRLLVDGTDSGVDVARTLFGEQPSAALDLAVVERGEHAVIDRVLGWWREGCRRVLADAGSDDHLRILAGAARSLDARIRGGVVSLSPGAWLRHLPGGSRPAPGYVLVVLSSATETNRRQLRRLAELEGAVVVNAAELGAVPPDRAATAGVVVIETLSCRPGVGDGAGLSRLAADAGRRFLAARGGCLGVVVGGGQTGSALMDQMSITELRAVKEIAPLCPLGRVEAGPWQGLPIVTKGGRIGAEHTLTDLVTTVWKEAM